MPLSLLHTSIWYPGLSTIDVSNSAGFFVSIANVPAVLRWVQWLDPLKYLLEALSINEVTSGLLIVDTVAGVPVSVRSDFHPFTLDARRGLNSY